MLSVSLVAEHEGTIVGHVAFSPAAADDGSTGWYTLGPVAVAPEYQRRNIGQSLIREGLRQLTEAGASGCIVLGDTGYYSRFGFDRAPALAPPGVPAEHFMVLCLTAPAPTAVLRFDPAFGAEGPAR